MSSEGKKNDAYLNDIRGQFLRYKNNNSNKELSWGQFLDHTDQVGLYGTVAAAIVLKTNQNNSPEGKAAETQLIGYWNSRNNQPQSDNLCQNIRLAALLLGLCFCSKNYSSTISEIAQELTNRFKEHENLWGDSSSPTSQEPAYSEFSSAIIIIFAFVSMQNYKGNNNDFGGLNEKLVSAANTLQKHYLDDSKRDRPYLLVLLIAVILIHGKTAKKPLRKRLSQYAFKSQNIYERFWYHLDYIDHLGQCKRDYFILPTRLLIPVLLLQSTIEGAHYLFSNNALGDIKEALDSNESKLFRETAGRASSLEQALVTIALKASEQESPKKYTLWIPRMYIAIKKSREPEWVFAWTIILLIYMPIALIISPELLVSIVNLDQQKEGRWFIESVKFVPPWAPAVILLAANAIRKPQEIMAAAIGKYNQK